MSHSVQVKNVRLTVEDYGTVASESGETRTVKLFTWRNQNRTQAQVITYGATIISLKMASKTGAIDDVVLGFDDIRGYIDNQHYYFGIIGRFANFISNGSFILNCRKYKLSKNLDPHHYNGGVYGFNRALWDSDIDGHQVIMSLLSEDGDDGYPGDLLTFVTYELTSDDELLINIKAHCTKPTIVNITNRCYFNLAGHGAGTKGLKQHVVTINAAYYTEQDEELLPTGNIEPVLDTIYDFQMPTLLASHWRCPEEFGFYTNYCVCRTEPNDTVFVARVTHEPTGRIMEVYSDQNGVEFETTNNFPAKIPSEYDVRQSRIPKLCPVTSIDLIDEVLDRVVEAKLLDKTNIYAKIERMIIEFQYKYKNMYRHTSGGTSLTDTKKYKISIENIHSIKLSKMQTSLIECVLREIKQAEPQHLDDLVEILEKVLKNNDDEEKVAHRADRERRSRSVGSLYNTKRKYLRKLRPRSSSFAGRGTFFLKTIKGKKGALYNQHGAFYLQTQNYPDACNIRHFPSCVLYPGDIYYHNIVYKFLSEPNDENIIEKQVDDVGV